MENDLKFYSNIAETIVVSDCLIGNTVYLDSLICSDFTTTITVKLEIRKQTDYTLITTLINKLFTFNANVTYSLGQSINGTTLSFDSTGQSETYYYALLTLYNDTTNPQTFEETLKLVGTVVGGYCNINLYCDDAFPFANYKSEFDVDDVVYFYGEICFTQDKIMDTIALNLLTTGGTTVTSFGTKTNVILNASHTYSIYDIFGIYPNYTVLTADKGKTYILNIHFTDVEPIDISQNYYITITSPIAYNTSDFIETKLVNYISAKITSSSELSPYSTKVFTWKESDVMLGEPPAWFIIHRTSRPRFIQIGSTERRETIAFEITFITDEREITKAVSTLKQVWESFNKEFHADLRLGNLCTNWDYVSGAQMTKTEFGVELLYGLTIQMNVEVNLLY